MSSTSLLIDLIFYVGVRMSRFVLTFEMCKTGNRMTESKLEAFLGRLRLTVIPWTEKSARPAIENAIRVRLFKG